MIPPKIFVNIYHPLAAQVGTAYSSKEVADQMAARGRLACVEVDLAGMLIRGFIHPGTAAESSAGQS